MDVEKEFDLVGGDFLHTVLEKFGFDKKFIKSIKTLYMAIIARIKVNRRLSGTIHLPRGCFLSCPASPVLFNLFIEPLAQVLKQNPDLEGITTKGIEHKVCLYMEDVLGSVIRNLKINGFPANVWNFVRLHP